MKIKNSINCNKKLINCNKKLIKFSVNCKNKRFHMRKLANN